MGIIVHVRSAHTLAIRISVEACWFYPMHQSMIRNVRRAWEQKARGRKNRGLDFEVRRSTES